MSHRRLRSLLVISADPTRRSAVDEAPRRDYDALGERLNAEMLSLQDVMRSPVAKLLARIVGTPLVLAWMAFARRADFDVLFTDGEHVGLPLAMLLKLAGSGVTHVTIGHRITARHKRPLFRWMRAQSNIDRIAVHAYRQVERGVSDLRISPEKLALVPYQVDTSFWRSRERHQDRVICSAGLEFRDYPTLFRAVDGLDMEVVVGASSNFSRRSSSAHGVTIPSNVRVSSFNYVQLREVYERSAIVVVPLDDVDFQAGVTTILEAMAMSRPVIVTQTQGQTDVVIDRRWMVRGMRPRPLSLLRLLAAEAGITARPNGFYVPPDDPGALRDAINYLLDNPTECEELGSAGRELVEHLCTPEQFAERMARLIDDAYASRLGASSLAHSSGLAGALG